MILILSNNNSAFVSGLDAEIYQTWPLMNYNYYPDDVKINSLIAVFDFDNQV